MAFTYPKFSGRSNVVRGQSSSKSALSSVGSISFKPRRVLMPKEIDEKRDNNMRFFCYEKYYPGQKCKC